MTMESVNEGENRSVSADEIDPASLVHAVIERVRWEMSNGAMGFRSPSFEPLPQNRARQTAVERPSPPPPEKPAAEPTASPEQPKPSRTTMGRSKFGSLDNLRAHIGDCTRCPLHEKRSHIVFGEGNPEARIVFVGEGPGRDEDLQGRPFVGAAGQLLDKIIGAMGLTRQDIYICNVVKCRPPQNRVPTQQEQGICGVFLKHQLAIIRPEVIVTLGATPAHYLLGLDKPVGRLRGSFYDLLGIAVMPTYHPAYLLRNPQAKKMVWNDMQLVIRQLDLPAISGKTDR